MLEGIVDSAHPANRIVKLDQRDDERNEQSCRHSLAGDLIPRIKQKTCDDENPKHFHQRRRQRVRHLLPQIQFENPLSEFAELAGLCLLHREGFNNTIAGDGLVETIGHFRHFLLIGFAEQSQLLSKPDSRIKDEWSQYDRNRGQSPIDRKDRDKQKNRNCPLFEEFCECFGCRGLNTLDIARNTRNQLSGRIEMKETERLVNDLVENVVSEIADNSLPEVGNHIDRAVFCNRFGNSNCDEQNQHGSGIQTGYAESRIDDRNGKDRSSGRAEQRIKNQSDQKRRNGFQQPDDRHKAERNQKNRKVGPDICPEARACCFHDR